MPGSGPGRSTRQGITLVQLMRMFPDDKAAEAWFIQQRWPDGVRCTYCDHADVQIGTAHPTMPFRCRACKKFFSTKTHSVMHSSKLGYQAWALALYMMTTNIKGVSSMKLHRDIGVRQATAWHLAHRIREMYKTRKLRFPGPVEADEMYVGGKEGNKHAKERLRAGRGPVGKAVVVGVKDRSSGEVGVEVVKRANGEALRGVVYNLTERGAKVFTDEARAYNRLLREHEAVRHSAGEYVRGLAHTNGIESFWSMFKRGYVGIYHWMSFKHLSRYVNEFAGRNNARPLDTANQLTALVQGGVGKRLRYNDLIGRERLLLITGE